MSSEPYCIAQVPIEELLPERLQGEAPGLRRQIETLDVWFDSGSSWAGAVEGQPGMSFPADLYLEVGLATYVKNLVISSCHTSRRGCWDGELRFSW